MNEKIDNKSVSSTTLILSIALAVSFTLIGCLILYISTRTDSQRVLENQPEQQQPTNQTGKQNPKDQLEKATKEEVSIAKKIIGKWRLAAFLGDNGKRLPPDEVPPTMSLSYMGVEISEDLIHVDTPPDTYGGDFSCAYELDANQSPPVIRFIGEVDKKVWAVGIFEISNDEIRIAIRIRQDYQEESALVTPTDFSSVLPDGKRPVEKLQTAMEFRRSK